MSLLTVLCPGPWANDILAKIGVKLPLQPWKIPVYYWKVKVRRDKQYCIVSCVDNFVPQEFLPHTFIYDCGLAREGHVWGLPEQEYPGLVKVSSEVSSSHVSRATCPDLPARGRGVPPRHARPGGH